MLNVLLVSVATELTIKSYIKHRIHLLNNQPLFYDYAGRNKLVGVSQPKNIYLVNTLKYKFKKQHF